MVPLALEKAKADLLAAYPGVRMGKPFNIPGGIVQPLALKDELNPADVRGGLLDGCVVVLAYEPATQGYSTKSPAMVETLARVRQGFGLQNEPEVDQEKEEPERQALEAEYRATSGILKSAAVRWATHGIGPTTIDAALRLLGKAYVTWTAKQLQDPVLLQAVLGTTPMELVSKPVNAPADRRHINPADVRGGLLDGCVVDCLGLRASNTRRLDKIASNG